MPAITMQDVVENPVYSRTIFELGLCVPTETALTVMTTGLPASIGKPAFIPFVADAVQFSDLDFHVTSKVGEKTKDEVRQVFGKLKLQFGTVIKDFPGASAYRVQMKAAREKHGARLAGLEKLSLNRNVKEADWARQAAEVCGGEFQNIVNGLLLKPHSEIVLARQMKPTPDYERLGKQYKKSKSWSQRIEEVAVRHLQARVSWRATRRLAGLET